jgi:predicted PurR-regulated permease PerM
VTPTGRRGDAPGGLWRAGTTGWLLTGVAVAIAIAVYLLLVSRPVLIPVLLMVGVATVAEPLVARLARWRVPRGLGATLVCLLILAIGAGVLVVFVVGIVDQWDSITQVVTLAVDEAKRILAGIPGATNLINQSANAAGKEGSTLAIGVFSRLSAGVASFVGAVIGVLLAVYILVFVLADGPRLHERLARMIPGPPDFGRTVTMQAAHTARRYFAGLTLIALMDAVVIGVAAWLLDVPFVIGITVLTFVAAYVPYVGAFLAGVFAVLLALGSGGLEIALTMLVVVIFTNGVLENLARPFTFGSALRLSPLTVLIVTLIGGALAGAVGMMIAAPVAAITADIISEVRRLRRGPRASVTRG